MSHILGVDSTGTIEIKMLTQDTIEKALAVQKKVMREENITISVGLYEEPGAVEEMQSAFREIIKEGVSIVAVDTATSEVVAALFNKIHVLPKDDEKDHVDVFINNLKHQSCRDLFEIADNIKNSINWFQKYNVNNYMELFFLAVNPKYRCRGIGRQMVKLCTEMPRRLSSGNLKKVKLGEKLYYEKVFPKLGVAILTSNYSQQAFSKVSCEFLVTIKYENLILRDKKLSERIGALHKTVAVIAINF